MPATRQKDVILWDWGWVRYRLEMMVELPTLLSPPVSALYVTDGNAQSELE
jgi:hypothetical protein